MNVERYSTSSNGPKWQNFCISGLYLLISALPGTSLWADPTQVDVSNSEFGPRILVAPDGRAGDRFGRSVSTGGDVIVVGADYSPCGCAAPPAGNCPIACTGPGAAYVFLRDYVDSAVGGYDVCAIVSF